MAKARVEVVKIPCGNCADTRIAANVVYALQMANRVVEAEWRDGQIALLATYPVPRAVKVHLPPAPVERQETSDG